MNNKAWIVDKATAQSVCDNDSNFIYQNYADSSTNSLDVINNKDLDKTINNI